MGVLMHWIRPFRLPTPNKRIATDSLAPPVTPPAAVGVGMLFRPALCNFLGHGEIQFTWLGGPFVVRNKSGLFVCWEQGLLRSSCCFIL